MKRIVSALLLLALLLCFCACDGSEKEPPKPKVLQVGFGRTDITPQLSVPLAGYGNTDKRMSLVA